MRSERAKEIWEARAPLGGTGRVGPEKGEFWGYPEMTDSEVQYVKKAWGAMPGWACFEDALLAISRGQDPLKKNDLEQKATGGDLDKIISLRY